MDYNIPIQSTNRFSSGKGIDGYTVTAYTIHYGVTVYIVYFSSVLCSKLLCACFGIKLFKFGPTVCKVSKYQEFPNMSFSVRHVNN